MNEEIVELLVRLACGEGAEPPVRGVVALHGERFRVWKHGERRRVESAEGELRSIREPERSLAFPVGGGVPVESTPGSLDYDEEDEPWVLIRRPDLGELDLRERRLDGTVVRGQRFGRETATLTLPDPEDEELGLTYVLDAATGMPLEVLEDGYEVLRWLELEVVDAIDPRLLTWDGEVAASGWFAYVGVAVGPDGEVVSDGPVPDSLRRHLREEAHRNAELEEELALHNLSAEVPLEFSVDTSGPDVVSLSLSTRADLTVWGTARPEPEEMNESSWTTADGWTWTMTGIDDPRLLATVRERITRWRERETP
ncbi:MULTISPECIES: hypothetical protein [unclassified Aeromicrobium]|uniref:hypothetical protein n=1 Tax=unclassified Aeromicrobium TaxID=2633570 RepID=UPI00396B16DE